MKKLLLLTLLCGLFTTGFAQLIKEKQPTDPKYLAGGVTMTDGKVTFTRSITISGKDADALYNNTLHWLGQYFKREEVLTRKSLERDSTRNYIKVGINEYIVFKKNVLCLDRSQMIYSLALQCKGNVCTVTMSDISYYYEEERNPEKYVAEEWITDENCLNKKKTKLLPLSGKFRVKTIDSFDHLCADLTDYCNKH